MRTLCVIAPRYGPGARGCGQWWWWCTTHPINCCQLRLIVCRPASCIALRHSRMPIVQHHHRRRINIFSLSNIELSFKIRLVIHNILSMQIVCLLVLGLVAVCSGKMVCASANTGPWPCTPPKANSFIHFCFLFVFPQLKMIAIQHSRRFTRHA